TQRVPIARRGRRIRRADAVGAAAGAGGLGIDVAELALFVVVPGAALLDVEPDIVLPVRRQRQTCADGVLTRLGRRGITAGRHVDVRCRDQFRAVATINVAAQLQAQHVLLQRAAGVEIHLARIAPIAVVRNAGLETDASAPLLPPLPAYYAHHAPP